MTLIPPGGMKAASSGAVNVTPQPVPAEVEAEALPEEASRGIFGRILRRIFFGAWSAGDGKSTVIAL